MNFVDSNANLLLAIFFLCGGTFVGVMLLVGFVSGRIKP